MQKFFTILYYLLFICIPLNSQVRIFTIGDSTVQDYNDGYAPRKGWGQMLPFFFDQSKAVVYNKAVGGTSSKSYYNNHWTAVKNQLKEGDYVFIQFGINDRNSSDANRYAPKDVFNEYIKKFVADIQAKKAIPVLVSTVRRCAWNNGVLYDSYHEHPQLMRDLATELSLPIVDLDQFCYDLFTSQGQLYAERFCTMHLVAGEYSNYPKGNTDQVHYQEIGATENARFVVETIEKSTNADLKKLAACTLPRHKVTIKINDATKSQAISRSAEFPEGINITLKTIPQTNAKFLRWEDDSKKTISTNSLYVLKMGSSDVVYKAVYESDIEEEESNIEEPSISIDNDKKMLVASSAKSYKWYFNNVVISNENSATISIANNGTYSVEMVLDNGSTVVIDICVAIGKDGTIRRIFLIGDSTVCNYKDSQYPMTGWGQVLHYFFNSDIEIYNHAIGGRSSRSFREQGRWKTVLNELKQGDFVFIQFGHNDRDNSKAERYTPVADYTKYIDSFVVETREKGAIPVLISPMVMNAWNNSGMRNVFTESGNDYQGAMEKVANERKCAFVNLGEMSHNLFKTTSSTYCSNFYYNTYSAGEYPNYPNGNTDGTHFQEMGALTLCRLITDGLKEIDDPFICALTTYLKPTYTLTVKANIDNYGSITASASFPEGAPVTLKVLPPNGETFLNWDQDGKNISDKTLYRFTMGSKNTICTAMFEGGSEVDAPISVTIPEGKKSIAYITASNEEDYKNDTKILPSLKSDEKLFVYEVDAEKNNVDLSNFDMILISEVTPSTASIMNSLKGIAKPMLSMKVHGYKTADGAWNWAKNGFGDNTEATTLTVSENMKSHPMFKDVTFVNGNEVQVVSQVDTKAITYMNPASFTNVVGEIVSIATAKGEDEQVSILEIPAGTSVAGTKLSEDYIQIGLNSSSYANITEDGVSIVKNACYYLLGINDYTTNVDKVASDLSCFIYPNPIVDNFTLSVVSNENNEVNVMITKIDGCIVYNDKVELSQGRNTVSFNRNGLTDGSYVLLFKNKDGSILYRAQLILK